MFNMSKIFDCDPQEKFWGEDLDKGICCIVDDLPPHYNKNTFSYLKGAITKTDTVIINEKHKPKRTLSVLPQIIACINHPFKLLDTSDGMRRRIKVLPTEFHIDDSVKDLDLQYKLVLNTVDVEKIKEYKNGNNFDEDCGEIAMYMYTKEKGVLDSLNSGSLCWFANKARYEYFKALEKGFAIGDSDDMKDLHTHTFKNNFEIECEEFIKWYVASKCGTDSSRDLSKANIHLNKLYPEYDTYCEIKGIGNKMTDGQLKRYCSPAIINSGYKITNKKMKKVNHTDMFCLVKKYPLLKSSI